MEESWDSFLSRVAMLLYLMKCFKFWIDLKLSDSCVRGRKFGVYETGRIERKGSMSHEAVVKLQNPRRMSLEV